MAYWDFIPGFECSSQNDEFCALISRNYTLGELVKVEETARGLNN